MVGHNRTNISKRAVRGSGGVGVLVKESMLDRFSIDVVDKGTKTSYGSHVLK